MNSEQLALLFLEGKNETKIKNIVFGKKPKNDYNYDPWCNCSPKDMKYRNLDFSHYIKDYTGEYEIPYYHCIPEYVWNRFGMEREPLMVIDIIQPLLPEFQFREMKAKAIKYREDLDSYFQRQRENNKKGLHCDYNNPKPKIN